MIPRKKENIRWLEFEQLQEFPKLVHGVFLRHGGASTGTFDSLNFGSNIGDNDAHVAENRKRAASALGLEELVGVHQVHGADLAEVLSTPFLKSCDGLYTQTRGLGLLIKHADCQAALFFDPMKQVIANVHCGWRGNVQNIYRKTVEVLQKKFGCKPENLLVCLSPSLGPDRSEFTQYKRELPKSFWEYQHKEYHFDLWEIAKMQLTSAGVLEHHIEVAELCTSELKKDFFSYRRDKKTGRHGTVLALK